MMDSLSSRNVFLFTAPRTASNLVMRILNLDGQPSIANNVKHEYFFAPTMGLRLGPAKLSERPPRDWLPEEEAKLQQSHQKCFDDLQKSVKVAASQGKRLLVKEHVSWLTEPVAEAKFVFGAQAVDGKAWTVVMLGSTKHSEFNETVFPDTFLQGWIATFLIRHPALVFPSAYRACIDNEGKEIARSMGARNSEMTMHWTRSLYDWYSRQADSVDENNISSCRLPIVLDADDIMRNPLVMEKYAKLIGLEPKHLRYSWKPETKEVIDRMSILERRMKSTISASTGVIHAKTSSNLDLIMEMDKWVEEFGKEEADKLSSWVELALPDYEYMRARRLKLPDDRRDNNSARE